MFRDLFMLLHIALEEWPMTPSNTKTPQSSIKRHHLLVGGASCASCVGKIEKALNGVSGVTDA